MSRRALWIGRGPVAIAGDRCPWSSSSAAARAVTRRRPAVTALSLCRRSEVVETTCPRSRRGSPRQRPRGTHEEPPRAATSCLRDC